MTHAVPLARPTVWRLPALHQAAFGGFLALTLARLLLTAADVWVMTGIGAILGALLWAGWAERHRPDLCPERAALLIYPVAMVLTFGLLRWAAPAIAPAAGGAAILAAWDARLFGDGLAAALDRWTSPPLTEAMAGFYIFFQIYIFWAQIEAALTDPARARRLFGGLYCVYAIGFLGYTLLPAPGPYAALPEALDGYVLMPLLAALYPLASNHVDAFPSLHVGVSVYILLFDLRYDRRRFWYTVLPVCGICLSTVYLRYHYVIDAISGALLAIVTRLWLAARERGWYRVEPHR